MSLLNACSLFFLCSGRDRGESRWSQTTRHMQRYGCHSLAEETDGMPDISQTGRRCERLESYKALLSARITLSTGETMPRSGENCTLSLFDEAMQIQSPFRSRQPSGSRLQMQTPSSSRGASLSNTRTDAKWLLSWISLRCIRRHSTSSRWPVAPTASVTQNAPHIFDGNAKPTAR